MALSSVLISYDIADMVGVDFDARRTKVWVTTNVPGDAVVDTVGNQIRLGDGVGTVNADGTGSVSVWIPGTGSNPASWQTTVHVDYAPRRPGAKREVRAFGPFTITAAANLADLIAEQEIPPTYVSTVVALLDGYVDDAEAAQAAAAGSASAASASATSAASAAAGAAAGVLAATATNAATAQAAQLGAEAARDDAEALIVSDLGTTDGQTRALIEGPTSQTSLALAKAYVAASQPALGLVTMALARSGTAPCNLVFAGSSTTEGNGASIPARRYVNRLVASLQRTYPAPSGVEAAVVASPSAALGPVPSAIPGVRGFNVGQGGTTAADYLTNAEIDAIAAVTPVLVQHMVGSNDYAFGVNPAAYQASIEDRIARFRSVATRPCTHLLVHSYQRADVGSPAFPWSAYGDALRNIARAHPDYVAFLDLSDDFAAVGVPGADVYDYLGPDSVHLTEAGHAALADLILGEVPLGVPAATLARPAPQPTLSRFTSDHGTGANTTSIVGRTTDVYSGGDPKTWEANIANYIGIVGNKLARTTSVGATYSYGIAMTSADYALSIQMGSLPTGGDLIVDLRRANVNNPGATPDAYRFNLTSAGTIVVRKRVSGVNTDLGSGYPYAVGDAITCRVKGTKVALIINGIVVMEVIDTGIAAAGYVALVSSGSDQGWSLNYFIVDLVDPAGADPGADSIVRAELALGNWQAQIPALAPAVSAVSWGGASFDAGYYMGMQRASSGGQNAEIVWKVDLSKGTWSIVLAHKKDTNRGIYTVQVDGVTVGTIDGYATGSPAATFDTIAGVVVPTSGVHTIRIVMATKNASATNYYGTPSALLFTRTA